MPQVQFTVTISGMRRSDVKKLAEKIQDAADVEFEDATLRDGRPMTMFIGQEKWVHTR